MNDQDPQEMPDHGLQRPEIEIEQFRIPGVRHDIRVTIRIDERVPLVRPSDPDEEPCA